MEHCFKPMKIALVAPDDITHYIYRKGLIISLIVSGHEVCLISKSGEHVPLLEKLGARHIHVNLGRFINPFQDLRLIIEFYHIFRHEKFDIIHNFTIKPNNYGTLMASAVGCKRIFNTVEGLGFMIYDSDEKSLISKVLKGALKYLYKLSSRLSEKTWFLNTDDIDYFMEHGLIKSEKVLLVKSTGINLDEWKLPPENKIASLKLEMGFHPDDILIVMVTRALNNKGIHEFLYAMEHLSTKYEKAKFVLAGGAEEDLDRGVPASLLQEKANKYPFFWLGHQNNIIDTFAISDIVVLPSYYREGVPRCLLEGMALKKPIVTTDNVGCRETVDDDVNGFLVPIKDGKSVADKIECLIKDPELRTKMGNAGFEKVKLEFDERLIVDALLNDLYKFNENTR